MDDIEDGCGSMMAPVRPEAQAAGALPAVVPGNLPGDDLAGVDPNSRAHLVQRMLPYAFLAGVMAGSHAVMFAVPMLAVATAVVGWFKRPHRPTLASRSTSSRALLSPGAGIRKGFGAIGLTLLSIFGLHMVGFPQALIYPPSLFRGLWAFWTWRAVRSASRTDAQTGWMTGATSLTAFSMLWWTQFEWYLGVVVPFARYAVPVLAAASIWQTWRYLSSRGVDRSRAALKAAVLGTLAALCFAPIGAPSFLPCVGIAAIATLVLPALTARQRVALPPASSPVALPLGQDPPRSC